jgi:DNA mismatch repair protein MutL
VPARLKFLKSDAVERNNIISMMKEIALCYHGLDFELVDQDKLLCSYRAVEGVGGRVQQVFGGKFASNMKEFSYSTDSLQIAGFLGLPTFMQHSSIHQHIFLNGRSVKEKTIYSAIKAAYSNVMSGGFYPAVVLYINVDPFEVDVNVHPAKTEVRLRDAVAMRTELVKALKYGINNMPLQASGSIAEAFVNRAIAGSPQFSAAPHEAPRGRNEMFEPTSLGAVQASIAEAMMPRVHMIHSHEIVQTMKRQEVGELGEAMFQVGLKYIISSTHDQLILVDQHAAHERIVLQQMMSQNSGAIPTQPMIIPMIVDSTEEVLGRLEEYLESIRSYGFEVRRHGINQLLVLSMPAFLDEAGAGGLIKRLLEELAEHGIPEMLLAKRDEILGNIACHNSLRAGKTLSLYEMNALLRQIENTPLAGQCNHGRPTFVKLSLSDLDAVFRRS